MPILGLPNYFATVEASYFKFYIQLGYSDTLIHS